MPRSKRIKKESEIGKLASREGEEQKSKQGVVNALLMKLPVEVRDKFLDDCKYNPSYAELKRMLCQLKKDNLSLEGIADIDIESASISHIGNWYRDRFPIGEEVKYLTQLTHVYKGADAYELAVATMGALGRIVLEGMQRLSDERTVATVPDDILFSNMPGYLRELRALMDDVHSYERKVDIKQSALGGGQMVADIVLNVLKDTTHEPAVKEALISALQVLEEKV